MSFQSLLHILLLTVSLAGAKARLLQPTGGQQLSAGGASAQANPEIDAWHAAEKARIEEECDELMKKLTAEKRQKLQDIVDAARRAVEEEEARLAAALADAEGEKKDLEDAKADIQKVRKPRMGPTKDLIGDQEAKIRELEKLIAEKQACIDELKQAELDLAEAKRKLAEAQAMVAKAKDARDAQKDVVVREEGDIPPAQADLDSAEEDLARAKTRHEAAAKRLSKAKADLKEHDMEGVSSPAPPAPAPAPAPAPKPEAKSGSRPAAAALGAFSVLLMAALHF
jgi:DNA repair exonuclease SbcCD ATPase subunit